MANDEKFFDREGCPVTYDVWRQLRQDVAYRSVARDATGEQAIVTDWLGEPASGSGTARMYHTYVSDRSKPNRVQIHKYYANEPDARKGHEECFRTVRRARWLDAFWNIVVPALMVVVLTAVILWFT